MPDTRPRIWFDESGQCNACDYHFNIKPKIDIIAYAERRKEFVDIVKSMKRHPVYDMVVPFSGGKDSATIAHRLKHEYGFRPLLVCYAQMMWTESGYHNFHQVANDGFDTMYFRVDQRVSRVLAKRFFIERGHPKVHYDAGINAAPLKIAQAMNIPLVIYAEHGETEYGGLVLSEKSRKVRDIEEVLEHCVGDDARNWATDEITEAELYPYIYPDEASDLRAFYWSYFHKWDIYENAIYARDKLGFRPAHVERTPEGADWQWGRSDGTFEGFDSIDDMIDDLDFYLMYRKFGFGRATRMASRLVQYGHMTREEGMRRVERYDGEYPSIYLDRVLEYLSMTKKDFDEVIRQHTERDLLPFDRPGL